MSTHPTNVFKARLGKQQQIGFFATVGSPALTEMLASVGLSASVTGETVFIQKSATPVAAPAATISAPAVEVSAPAITLTPAATPVAPAAAPVSSSVRPALSSSSMIQTLSK